ncbi:ABC transporter ATP-binding protein [Clostridium sp. 'deep sea']|uniref:ABC transporter ATP-binding protein n=1 Tax=Clostridium sp. 'deep sea' TaxID=2779445 RepID=UPI0018964AE7|nr:ABC transporter ATP-binding protein [Clostridium sp. 'deep sea']QOR33634.1 ABC transporter ATP-binding protein [Clostridium sp. 'deep sea']
MISVKNLCKSYGQHQVLKGLTLSVKTEQNKGTIYGFLGKNGAGKTTTMNILNGLAKFNAGECYVLGTKLTAHTRQQLNSVAYLPESPGLYPYMTGKEYLDFIGYLKTKDKTEVKKRTTEMLELTSLQHAKNKRIGGYSRGMKQRIAMAAAMYHKPKLIFLDEPTSALDPQGRKDVLKLLQHLRETGCSIFLSTHILSDVEKVCDTIGILHNGKLLLEENMRSLMKNQVSIAYTITFKDKITKNTFNTISNYPYVKELKVTENELIVWLKDNVANILLKNLGNIEQEIESCAKRKPNLEDIFINTLSK